MWTIMNTYIRHKKKLGTYFWNIVMNKEVLINRGWKTVTFSVGNKTLALQHMFNMFPVHIDIHFGTLSYRSTSSKMSNIFLISWHQLIKPNNWFSIRCTLLYTKRIVTLKLMVFERIKTRLFVFTSTNREEISSLLLF